MSGILCITLALMMLRKIFKDGNTDGFDKIPVPSCRQTQGYDRHQYTNTRYPFPYNPPYVPYDNPCGAYLTHFESDNDYRKYLNFEGVDSSFLCVGERRICRLQSSITFNI